MTKAIDQLAELVRQAEAKTRARKIESETQQVAEQFRVAEQRARRTVERHRVARPVSMQSLEQANTDEQLLKDLVRKLALYKSSLSSQADAEKLIAASQSEIERTRGQSRQSSRILAARLMMRGVNFVQQSMPIVNSVANSTGSGLS